MVKVCPECGRNLFWIQYRDVRKFPPYSNAPKFLLDDEKGYFCCESCASNFSVREIENGFR